MKNKFEEYNSTKQSKILFKTTLAEFINEYILREVIDCDGDGNIVEVNKLLNIPQVPAMELKTNNKYNTAMPVKPREVKEYIKEAYKIDMDEKILNMYTYRSLEYFNKKEILYDLNTFEKIIRDKIKNIYNEYILIENINKVLNEMQNDNKKSNAQNTIYFLCNLIVTLFQFLLQFFLQ